MAYQGLLLSDRRRLRTESIEEHATPNSSPAQWPGENLWFCWTGHVVYFIYLFIYILFPIFYLTVYRLLFRSLLIRFPEYLLWTC